MAARHFKYTYNAHIPPKIILSRMLNANILENMPKNSRKNIGIDYNSEKNKIYFSRRNQLRILMKQINFGIFLLKMEFNHPKSKQSSKANCFSIMRA